MEKKNFEIPCETNHIKINISVWGFLYQVEDKLFEIQYSSLKVISTQKYVIGIYLRQK